MKITKELIERLATRIDYECMQNEIADDLTMGMLTTYITEFFRDEFMEKYIYALET